jgi:hypothetical protein
MKPVSKYYEDGVRKWLHSHPGYVAILFQMASIFSAAIMLTKINDFRRTGVWPVDISMFTEADFQIFCQLTQLTFGLMPPPPSFPPTTSLALDVRPYKMILQRLEHCLQRPENHLQ